MIIMKIALKNLVNSAILNDKSYVGFQGDSEFVDEDGKLHFGTWTYKDNLGLSEVDDFDKTLDSKVHENLLFGAYNPFEIYNDNGELCIVEIQYHR